MNTQWIGIMALLLGACGIAGTSLPDGYAVRHGDRGTAWLANPDGTLAHPALIKQLFRDDRRILLITFAATYEGKVEGPRPLDGNCYVAISIETREHRMSQVRLAEANSLAAAMTLVESSDRGCLQGMPTS